jgi:hypothetical protein
MEILDHLESGESDVAAVQPRDNEEQHQKRHDPPCDLVVDGLHIRGFRHDRSMGRVLGESLHALGDGMIR